MFWHCFWYLFCISVLAFFVGRILPKNWFMWNKYPYHKKSFEEKLYRKLKIGKWQNYMLDMSKIFKNIMPAKAIKGKPNKETLTLMLRETCIAECIHKTESLLGFFCMFIWRDLGGIIISLIYFLIGNLPYILIQRYNRPRLVRLLHILEEREKIKETESDYEVASDACFNTVM